MLVSEHVRMRTFHILTLIDIGIDKHSSSVLVGLVGLFRVDLTNVVCRDLAFVSFENHGKFES